MGASRKPVKNEPECLITVHVLPRSSRNSIEPQADNTYKVKLTSPPVEGAANKQLIEVIAGRLSIPKRNIEIVSGGQSRTKRIRIRGIRESELILAMQ